MTLRHMYRPRPVPCGLVVMNGSKISTEGVSHLVGDGGGELSQPGKAGEGNRLACHLALRRPAARSRSRKTPVKISGDTL